MSYQLESVEHDTDQLTEYGFSEFQSGSIACRISKKRKRRALPRLRVSRVFASTILIISNSISFVSCLPLHAQACRANSLYYIVCANDRARARSDLVYAPKAASAGVRDDDDTYAKLPAGILQSSCLPVD